MIVCMIQDKMNIIYFVNELNSVGILYMINICLESKK